MVGEVAPPAPDRLFGPGGALGADGRLLGRHAAGSGSIHPATFAGDGMTSAGAAALFSGGCQAPERARRRARGTFHSLGRAPAVRLVSSKGLSGARGPRAQRAGGGGIEALAAGPRPSPLEAV
jgi:hypothetical protein